MDKGESRDQVLLKSSLVGLNFSVMYYFISVFLKSALLVGGAWYDFALGNFVVVLNTAYYHVVNVVDGVGMV